MMFNHDQWAHYYLNVGRKNGRLEGGFWGFLAGFLTYYLFWSRS